MNGKCPKCQEVVLRANIADVPARAFMGRTEWKAISFNCPLCNTVIGMQIDPIAIKTDIIDELMRKLRG